MEVLIDIADETHWVLHERWESLEHDRAYREFRAGPGALVDLVPLLTQEPSLTWFSPKEGI